MNKKVKNKQSGFSIVEVLVVILVLGLVGVVGWLVYDRQNNKKTVPQSTQSTQKTTDSQTTETTKPIANSAPKTGLIKGDASYPSEGLPTDEEICAEYVNDTTKAPVCVNVGKPTTIHYTLEVPTGTYYVYAKSGNMPNYKAYYNEFSRCGATVSCPKEGHKQYIQVVVEAGKTVESVNPGDWYANN